MPQQHDLGFQPRLRLEPRDQDVEEQDQEPDHRGSAYPIVLLIPARMAFSVSTVGCSGSRLLSVPQFAERGGG